MEDFSIKACSGYDPKKKICKHGHKIKFGSVVCSGCYMPVKNKKILTPSCVVED